jgi:hypothetical protein
MCVCVYNIYTYVYIYINTGGSMNIDPPDWIMELIFPTLIDPPAVFMVLNLVCPPCEYTC